MSELLIKLFEKKNAHCSTEKYGIFAGTVGLICNAILFAFKITIGLISSSVSILADAVNNLSDAAASLVTLFGFKLSGKPADKEHPFGHARVEYMASAVIAVFMLVLGGELAKRSVEKIITPEDIVIAPVMLIIIVGAMAVKLFMMCFYKKVGAKIKSVSLGAASADSRNDIFMTGGVLAGAAIQFFFNFNIDGYIGAAVAVFIIISGFSVLKDSLSPLLGEAPSDELVKNLFDAIIDYRGVIGIHDLVVHSYGPSRIFATVHVEMSASSDPLYCHGILDHIERNIKKEFGVDLVTHLDPVAEKDEEYNRIKGEVKEAVKEIDERLSIHDFRMVRTHDHINLIYDVEVPSEYECMTADLEKQIIKKVKTKSKSYYSVINIDRNYNMSEIEGK